MTQDMTPELAAQLAKMEAARNAGMDAVKLAAGEALPKAPDNSHLRRYYRLRPHLDAAIHGLLDSYRYPVKLTKAGKPAKRQPKRRADAAVRRILLSTASDATLIATTRAAQEYFLGDRTRPYPLVDHNGR